MVIRGTDGDNGEKSPVETDIHLCLSISGINYIPPLQGTAQDSSHPPTYKSHAINQLVHGNVSWGCGVTPNYPPEGSDDGVILKILGMKQQGMDYLCRTVQETKSVCASQNDFSRNSLAWSKSLAMRMLSRGDQP